MVSDYMKHYKPSSKAWVAVSVIALSVVAIVYAVCAVDWNIRFTGGTQIEVKTGKGAIQNTITVHNHHKMGL